MTLPTNHTPAVILGGTNVDATMPRLLVEIATASGQGGNTGGGTTVIDANNVIWLMITDTSTSPASVYYYQFGTTTVGNPTLPVVPYEYVVGSVSTPDLTTIESDISASGTVTSSTPLIVQLINKSTFSFIASGTWTGTAAITGSIDGTNYSTLGYFNRTTGANGTTFTTNIAGQVNIVGLKYIKFTGVATGSLTLNYIESRLSVVNTAIVSAINGGTP